MPNFGVSAALSLAAVQRRDLERLSTRPADHRLSAGRRDPRATTSRKAWPQGNVRRRRRLQPGLLRAARRRACRSATAANTAIGPDYHQRYLGFEVQATKRLSNRWMARVGFSTNSPSRVLRRPVDRGPGSDAVDHLAEHRWRRVRDADQRQRQERDLPASAALPVHGRRSVSVRRTGINVAGSLVVARRIRAAVLRTRSSRPIRRCPRSGCCSSIRDDNRLPGVFTLDLRGGEVIHVRQPRACADARPVQRDELVHELGRQYDTTATGATGFNQPLEIMNPRLIRLGVRFQF